MRPQLAEHFFRHEYGKLVATLARRFGASHLQDIEDAVQSALLKGLETWTVSGVPESPSAWLFRVAQNNLFSERRKQANRKRLLEESHPQDLPTPHASQTKLEDEMQDDLLHMLFVACDDTLPPESQLVFALKTLCGFSIQEIATRLFTSEANAYKRYSRARNKLKTSSASLPVLSETQLANRLPSIQRALYLLFTEGHLSTHATIAIRRDLTEEAIRLATLLVQHPIGQNPSTQALLALFHFHSARMNSRQNEAGELLLLEEQNRNSWDQTQIQTGLRHLAQSASGDAFTRYHAEAGIAAQHCLAPSFAETDWEKIAELYALLNRVSPSPLHRLNQALALAEFRSPKEALNLLSEFTPPTWLATSYQYYAVQADLHRRANHQEEAEKYKALALETAPSKAIRTLIQRRLKT